MSDMQKRKNDDFPRTSYDHAWLFRLYRWLRWDRVRAITVDAPPDKCQRWIDSLLKAHHHRKNQAKDDLYEFQIVLFTGEGRPSDVGTITVQIRTVVGEEEKSKIFLRAYPGIVNTGCATIFTAIGILMACGAISSIIQFKTILEGICCSLFMLVVIAIVWILPFSGRNEALDIIATPFINSANQAVEKSKTERRSRSPFEEVVIPEIGTYEHKTQE